MKRIGTVIFMAVLAFIISSCKGDPGSPGSFADNVFMAQFQQGILPSSAFNGVLDTYIVSGSRDNINADCANLYLGRYGSDTTRIGFSCDLTSIPPEATIVKAYLTLTTNAVTVQGVTATAFAQPLFWWPGSSGCNVTYASTYDAHWNGPWSTTGGDLSRPMSDTSSVSSTSSNRAITFELNTSIVRNWVRNGVSNSPDANYGLIIKSSNEASGSYITVYSSNNTTNISYRPILTVYYTMPF
ncbi:MAG: hypothetical protein ABSD46_01970 [Bacteroidota bacterium]